MIKHLLMDPKHEILFFDDRVGYLRKQIRSGGRQHAYIFTGPEHIGKFLVAKRFASALSMMDVSMLDIDRTNFQEIMTLRPEIIVKDGVEREKVIDVDSIRDLRRFLSLYPEKGRRRVGIIDNAHMLTIQGQNALLKTLEEPPEGAVVILITHRAGSILPTIFSRARHIYFSLPPQKELRSWIDTVSAGNTDEWECLSLGCPGTVFRMMEDENELKKRRHWLERLQTLRTADPHELLLMGESASKDAVAAREMLKIWEYALRKESFSRFETARRNYSTIERIEGMIELLLSTNANKRLILEAFFLSCRDDI